MTTITIHSITKQYLDGLDGDGDEFHCCLVARDATGTVVAGVRFDEPTPIDQMSFAELVALVERGPAMPLQQLRKSCARSDARLLLVD